MQPPANFVWGYLLSVHANVERVLIRCAYTNWTTTATDCNDFFTDPNAIQLYKNHIRTVLTRVNTVTGIPYGSDPTIMGEC